MSLLLVVAIFAIVIILPIIIRKGINSEKESFAIIVNILFYAYCISILIITLYRSPADGYFNLTPFQCIRGLANQIHYSFYTYGWKYNAEQFVIISNGITCIVLNILLFIPLGFFIPIVFNYIKKSYIIVVIGMSLSIAIEIAQFLLHRGCLDIDDVIFNTLGTLLGWAQYKRYLTN